MLLADSSPRWEFRYLKTLFERDPTVSLKSVLQEADIEYAAEDKTALAHFPLNREELFAYDVLILGDLNPALLGTSTMELIRSFVRDSGGGVLMIAGTGFNPLAYRGNAAGIAGASRSGRRADVARADSGGTGVSARPHD